MITQKLKKLNKKESYYIFKNAIRKLLVMFPKIGETEAQQRSPRSCSQGRTDMQPDRGGDAKWDKREYRQVTAKIVCFIEQLWNQT